jgi:hypothetical protein
VASWTYNSPLSLDKYLISIPSAAATNALNASLDGEWTTGSTSYPSGDGTAGGDLNFRFNLLPSDVDQSGAVNALDGGNVRQHFLQFANTAGYNPLYDVLGKGAITGIDFLTVQGALFSTLPNTDPTPSAPPIGGGAATTAAAASPASAVGNVAGATAVVPGGTAPAAATFDAPAATASPPIGLSGVSGPGVVPSATEGTSAAGGLLTNSLSVGGAERIQPTSAGRESFTPNLDTTPPTSASNMLLSSEQAGTTPYDIPTRSKASDFRAGWLAARDSVFAELDADAILLADATLRDLGAIEPDLRLRSGS